MESAQFNELVFDTLNKVQEILVAKGVEYVPGGEEQDRFHNFEISAAFNQQRTTESLWGFLTKHLVSLSDMVKVDSTDHTMEKWEEKIHDAIIYLILLKGIVTENDQKMERLKSEAVNISTKKIDGDVHIHGGPSEQQMMARNSENLKAKYGPDSM
ncbi:hypothetical protein PBI_UNTOUCHABLE_55 [Gordonia phage Untouchable]|uniref:Uncharacterized protein n=1 Tax=Gordonia phage Untouchable TaxID=2656542 RepID=A0A649VAF2_9CAUD|nr:hypothetical protein HWC79_gp55 [Gordonia phage Untouchable]QGJ89099.1 hypothetical protein PBI_UNTOUCHABLE_55 [Gordonia phage Untouchable]